MVWDPVQERYETRDGALVGASVGAGALSTRTLLVYGPELGTPVLWEGATTTANRSTLATNASIFTGAITPVAPLGKMTATGGGEYGEINYHVFTGAFTHRLADKWYVVSTEVRSRVCRWPEAPAIRAGTSPE